MISNPSIVVFDSSWLNDQQANSHRPLLENILSDLRLKIHGFSLFESRPITRPDRRPTEQVRPVTPAQAIANLNPALIIVDPMISVDQGMMDIMSGTRLFIWIRQQMVFENIPIVFITDVDIDAHDKKTFQARGLVEIYKWSDLRNSSIVLKSVIANALVKHKRKTTP